MRPRELDAATDKLYQLPLDQFTAARNALAREAGARAGEIRRLQKPPLAAWAVNQLYWTNRAVYDALVEAATGLRRAHEAVLGGRRADLRSASKAHDEALDSALAATLELLTGAGHTPADATRQAVLNTLRALPSTTPPGRLAQTLQPGGFEMLSGLTISPVKAPAGTGAPAAARTSRQRTGAAPSGPRRRETPRDDRSAAASRRAEARLAVAEASRASREAETAWRRREFDAARAGKEAQRAAARLEDARAAHDAAERELRETERAAAAADKARDRARREAEDARAAFDAARGRLDAAQQTLNDA